MKQFILSSIFIFISTTIFSQNSHNLNGKVTNEKNGQVTVGDVLLLHNNSIVKYTSINNGNFLFEAILQGNYTLKISGLGYETYIQKVILDKNLQLTVTLKEATTKLDEVTITATKKLIENKNGNIVANIEGTLLSKESNTIDLLSKLPSVQVSPNRETISLVGKGNPLIYLGGQRISIEEFGSLQVDDIKTIEIINNPSAKYESEGRSVILITRKKSTGKGTKVSLTETASLKNYFNNYLSTNLNTKNNNLELKFDAAYNQLKVWESNSLDYEVVDQNINSNYLVKAVTIRPQFVFGGGLYYQLNPTDYISMSTRYRTQKDPFFIKTNTFLNENDVENNIYSYSDNVGIRRFSSSNINYAKTINKKSNLFTGIQYTYFKNKIENYIKNTYDNPFQETFFDRVQDFEVGSFSFRSDYDISFKKDNKLELGINYVNTSSNALIEIENNTTKYKYIENNTAVYSQFSSKIKKVNYSFGLRAEKTKVKAGFIQSNDLTIDRNNTFLFPKGNINFAIDRTKTLSFNYSKTISRPNYSSATSTVAFINPILEFRGNISLKPTLTDEVSAIFQYKGKSLTAQYTHMKNPVHYSLIYDTIEKTSVMFPGNFKEEYGFALNLSLPFKYKFWSSDNLINLNYNTIDDVRVVSLKTTTYLYLYTNHQFKINNTTSFNLNGWTLTNRQEGIFDRKLVYAINATFTKKLFEKLDVTINFNDIFNTMTFKESYQLQNIKAKSVFFSRSYEFAISLKYSFGVIKSSYKNKDIDNNLNRIR
jgi:hypothetical protein